MFDALLIFISPNKESDCAWNSPPLFESSRIPGFFKVHKHERTYFRSRSTSLSLSPRPLGHRPTIPTVSAIQLPAVMVGDQLDHVLSWFLNALNNLLVCQMPMPGRQGANFAFSPLRPEHSRLFSSCSPSGFQRFFRPKKKDIPSIKKHILLPGLRPMDPCLDATAPLLRRCPMDLMVNSTIPVLQITYFRPGKFSTDTLHSMPPRSRRLRGTSMSV